MTRINSSKWWRRPLLSALGTALFCLTFSGIASAELTDRKTFVTFNGPFEIPGTDPQVLPAGTYVFRIMENFVDRNIVQVSNKEENRVLSLILAIPTRREVETSKTVMTFEERTAGQPQALKKWFYPYEKWGQEFVYTHHAEAALAAAATATTTIVATPPILAAPEPEAVAVVLEPAAQPEPIPVAVETAVVAVREATAVAEPAPEPAPVEEARAEARVEEAAVQQPAPIQNESLPQTATYLPLLLLAGLALLGAGFSIRRFGNS